MTFHDELADILSKAILVKYKDKFHDVFISNVSMDFPKPDFVYLPINNNIDSVAFEVKTPFVYKHEYMTGLGQTIAYNTFFPLSYIVIPNINMDGFKVGDYIDNIVRTNNLKIGIFTYRYDKVDDISLIKPAEKIEVRSNNDIKKIKRSYSYWRETIPEEVYYGLRITKENKMNLNEILNELWNSKLKRRFSRAKRKSSFLLNYRLFFIQNALLDSNGKLTIIGKHVLELGERFGYDSELAAEIITYIILRYGGHYLLLSKIYSEQLSMNNRVIIMA